MSYLVCFKADKHLSLLLFLIFMNDISDIIYTLVFFISVNNVKMYLPIHSIEDSVKLQNKLGQISCLVLHVNALKYPQISFIRNRSLVAFLYDIAIVEFNNVSHIKDLGIVLSSVYRFLNICH